MTEELRGRLASLGPGDGPGPNCPPNERIFAGATGELPPDELARLLDHVRGCAWCSTSWGLAREVAAPVEAARGGGGGDGEVVSLLGRRGAWAVAGAALLAAALALVSVRVGLPEHAPVYRSAQEAALSARTPDALPRDGFALAWSAVPGATYEITVVGPDLAVVARASGLAKPEWVVPADALAGLPDGANLAWTVEAVDADGARLAQATFHTRLLADDEAAPATP